MIAYTGHRDDLEPGRGGARSRRATSRARTGWSAVAVFAIYFTLPADRAVGAARSPRADGELRTLLGLPPEEGGFAERPGARRRREPRARGVAARRRSRSTSACSRRRSSSSPRTPASSAPRASRTRWPATGSCPARLPPAAPAVQDAVALAGGLRRARLDLRSCSRAQTTSSGRCTPSARCSRSRSRTSRSIALR